jgi:hypothetical protein
LDGARTRADLASELSLRFGPAVDDAPELVSAMLSTTAKLALLMA